ncbi:MAG: hypothetical protein R3324_06865 [Halobacteriales archaeon]|nr:hypothetical protein [Halobacteriales archaeon]
MAEKKTKTRKRSKSSTKTSSTKKAPIKKAPTYEDLLAARQRIADAESLVDTRRKILTREETDLSDLNSARKRVAEARQALAEADQERHAAHTAFEALRKEVLNA